MPKRKVSIFTFIKLMASKKPHFIIGIALTVFALISFIMITAFETIGDNYDYDAIYEIGVEKAGHIEYIESVNNVTINGEHPARITYTYVENGITENGEFETLDLRKAEQFAEGEDIKIKVYNGESAIIGLEPFQFPFYIFMLFPVFFLIAGIIMLFISAWPVLNVFRLYKSGQVKVAEVYAIMPVAGLPITNMGRKVAVDYKYTDSKGNVLYGNAVSEDFTLLSRINPGDAVKIFVSETDEGKSTIVPQDLARKNNWDI